MLRHGCPLGGNDIIDKGQVQSYADMFLCCEFLFAVHSLGASCSPKVRHGHTNAQQKTRRV